MSISRGVLSFGLLLSLWGCGPGEEPGAGEGASPDAGAAAAGAAGCAGLLNGPGPIYRQYSSRGIAGPICRNRLSADLRKALSAPAPASGAAVSNSAAAASARALARGSA